VGDDVGVAAGPALTVPRGDDPTVGAELERALVLVRLRIRLVLFLGNLGPGRGLAGNDLLLGLGVGGFGSSGGGGSPGGGSGGGCASDGAPTNAAAAASANERRTRGRWARTAAAKLSRRPRPRYA